MRSPGRPNTMTISAGSVRVLPSQCGIVVSKVATGPGDWSRASEALLGALVLAGWEGPHPGLPQRWTNPDLGAAQRRARLARGFAHAVLTAGVAEPPRASQPAPRLPATRPQHLVDALIKRELDVASRLGLSPYPSR